MLSELTWNICHRASFASLWICCRFLKNVQGKACLNPLEVVVARCGLCFSFFFCHHCPNQLSQHLAVSMAVFLQSHLQGAPKHWKELFVQGTVGQEGYFLVLAPSLGCDMLFVFPSRHSWRGKKKGRPTNIFSRLRVTCFWCLDKGWYCCRWSALLSTAHAICKAMRSPVPLLMSPMETGNRWTHQWDLAHLFRVIQWQGGARISSRSSIWGRIDTNQVLITEAQPGGKA